MTDRLGSLRRDKKGRTYYVRPLKDFCNYPVCLVTNISFDLIRIKIDTKCFFAIITLNEFFDLSRL